ncbi:MAG: PLP-dependent lyase/thiolase [bacterium]
MKPSYLCLLCNRRIDANKLSAHKAEHKESDHYGFLWPLFSNHRQNRRLCTVATYTSPYIAQELGISKVYIRDEGSNLSGSMKDYLVEQAVIHGMNTNHKIFSVVSSGNHAVSLARYTNFCGAKAIVFVPASSSKIPILAALPNTLVIGIKDAIFEEVYAIGAKLDIPGIYNANVSNELLLTGLSTVSNAITALQPLPTHILAGVGNGSYLAGIAFGLQHLNGTMPKIIPVGMKGAFPTEQAFSTSSFIHEYETFLEEETLIDAAEGSIAIASYSMPQLIHALRTSQGFTLGGLINDDLAAAYNLLIKEKVLAGRGVIPEPTGIMGLAAALKHRDKFQRTDILHISFTGHAVKDCDGIERLLGEAGKPLTATARKVRPDLIGTKSHHQLSNVVTLEKECHDIKSCILEWLKENPVSKSFRPLRVG